MAGGNSGDSLLNMQCVLGRGRPIPNQSVLRGPVNTPIQNRRLVTPDSEFRVAQDPFTSTPLQTESDDALRHLSVLITELGKNIGDSVTARLMSDSHTQYRSSDSHTTPQTHNPATLDLSQLNVVLKSDAKEPTVFRGEGADKCSVQEWIDLMTVYLRKKNISALDQSEEIMSKLMGRAKDVVRIGLRSDPSLHVTQHPETIYAILRQHFSELSYSCMPLADFYGTLPKANESPVDYWVRLNKAADAAEESLRRQGRGMEDINKEVAMMFVRHCTDPSLSIVFKSKLVSAWTAKEVQERIDEYQRELKSGPSHHPRQAVARVSESDNTTQIPLHYMTPATQSETTTDVTPPTLQTCKQTMQRPQRSEETSSLQTSMDRMTEMLGQVLSTLSERAPITNNQGWSHPQQSRQHTQRRWRTGEMGGRRTDTVRAPCAICHQRDHPTHVHCMQSHLCFRCYEPGHTRDQCTASPSQRPQPSAIPAPPHHSSSQGNETARM